MFKKENQIWVYLIGTLILFGIIIFLGRDLFIPLFYARRSIELDQNFSTAPSFSIDTNKDYLERINTNFGTITVDLFEKNAPQNVNNFIYLSSMGYYTRTKFHRLIPDFLIQGGDRNTLNDDLTDDGKGRTGYFIKDEINWDSLDLSQEKRNELSNLGYKSTPGVESKPLERYSLAMANNGPDENSSQFFIIISAVDDSRLETLNGKFTVIGKVVSGGDILDEISKIPVVNIDSNTPTPTKDIIINSTEVYTR